MFGFKDAKFKVHDWAHDTVGTYERTLEVVKEVLDHASSIVNIWEKDNSYIMSQRDIYQAKGYFYKFDVRLLEYYTSNNFANNLQELISRGEDKNQAKTKLLYEYYHSLGYSNEEDFTDFLRLTMELDKAMYVSETIKRDLIKKNYSEAFFRSHMINLIRQKNGVYAEDIGTYENVIKILGENGILIQSGDTKAINYIEAMEAFRDFLENKKSIIELELADPRRH